MTLPDAVAAPRASQRNSATTEAEPAFQTRPRAWRCSAATGEAYRAPAGNEIGAATGIEFTSPGQGHGDRRTRRHGHGHGHGHGHWARAAHHGGRGHGGRNDLGFLAVAEPNRRGGGRGAAVVTSGR